jgi:glycerol kinase
MAKAWILAVDQGTTNTKALLVDREARVVFRESVAVDFAQPRPGWVEQDPLALWRSVCHVMETCAHFAASERGMIAGIALSNQRETAVLWKCNAPGAQQAGEPMSSAISWQCRRSLSVCERMAGHAAQIQARSGLPLDPLLTATKWAWALEERPELRAMAASGELLLGTVDAWLLYNLTGGALHATDCTNASRTALLNLATQDWDEDLLNLFEIPRQALPRVLPSSGIFAECTAIPGLRGVPIAAAIGDSHAALVGHGRYESGVVKATYGTGSSLMMLTPERVNAPDRVNVSDRLARTVAWSAQGETRFALEGNIAMSGAAVQWVGEFLGLSRPVEDAAALAATVPDASGVVLVPAMVGLGAPHWDSAARGLIANLERSHTAAHLARAAMDAIAHQVADVLEAMEEAACFPIPALLADGGATRNDALMQVQADLLGRPVHRSAEEDLSARGAAMLAGLAVSWWKSFAELSALPNSFQIFLPQMSQDRRESLRSSWRLAVRRARLQAEAAA